MRHFASLATSVVVAGILATEGAAFQTFLEYRILGSEIASVKIIEPEFPEDPVAIAISITTLEDDILIESDDDLSECRKRIDKIIGSEADYVQIVTHANSDTMNGALVVQCVTLSGLGSRE